MFLFQKVSGSRACYELRLVQPRETGVPAQGARVGLEILVFRVFGRAPFARCSFGTLDLCPKDIEIAEPGGRKASEFKISGPAQPGLRELPGNGLFGHRTSQLSPTDAKWFGSAQFQLRPRMETELEIARIDRHNLIEGLTPAETPKPAYFSQTFSNDSNTTSPLPRTGGPKNFESLCWNGSSLLFSQP
jgi:hypothetical protein